MIVSFEASITSAELLGQQLSCSENGKEHFLVLSSSLCLPCKLQLRLLGVGFSGGGNPVLNVWGIRAANPAREAAWGVICVLRSKSTD